jgi:hypothetical protein
MRVAESATGGTGRTTPAGEEAKQIVRGRTFIMRRLTASTAGQTAAAAAAGLGNRPVDRISAAD